MASWGNAQEMSAPVAVWSLTEVSRSKLVQVILSAICPKRSLYVEAFARPGSN